MDKSEVERYLNDLRTKKKVFGIIFYNERNKNVQALLDLEITPVFREKILDEIIASDYVHGPLEDKAYGGSDMWVFGKTVKGTEVYIKITIGNPNAPTICISFHPAEHKLTYPF